MTIDTPKDPPKDPASLAAYKKPLILKRWWVVFFTSSACFLMFLLRYNMSVAIVAILNERVPLPTPLNSTESQLYSLQLPKKYQLSDWMVSQIIASYFYGYTFFQFPAGRLSELFNAKHILGLSTLVSGLLSFVSPFLLDWSPLALIAGRIVVGSCHATVLCTSYTLFAEWMPKEQRFLAITISNVGYEFGGVFSFFMTGLICSGDPGPQWRYSFYLFAVPALLWFGPYCYLVYSKPEDDPNLSDFERELLKVEQKTEYANQDLSKKNMIKIPPKFNWRVVLTSKPVIASCINKTAVALGYYIITTKIPSYLNDIFQMPIGSNGSLTALTATGIMISKLLCIPLSFYLTNRRLMSLTNLRKLFQTIAMLMPAISLFVLTCKNDSQTLDITLIFLAMFGMGFICLGETPICAEFAKDLSGSIFGISNTFNCACGIVAPILVGLLTNESADKATAWNTVFYITIIFYLIGALTFVLFASAELQPWAESKFIPIDEFNCEPKSVRKDNDQKGAT